MGWVLFAERAPSDRSYLKSAKGIQYLLLKYLKKTKNRESGVALFVNFSIVTEVTFVSAISRKKYVYLRNKTHILGHTNNLRYCNESRKKLLARYTVPVNFNF